MMFSRLNQLALLFLCAPAFASEQGGPTSGGSLLQVLLVLILVLGLLVGAAWLMKRFNFAGTTSGGAIRVIGGIAVGSRERIMVVEVADQWIVVGVTAGQISALSTMPRQEIQQSSGESALSNSFAGKLKQFIEKRNDK